MEGFDTMNDAPEKIWRWDVYAWDHIIEYSEFPVISENSIEYTRSDIAQARIDKLETALTWISLGPSYYETPEGAVLEMMRVASEALKGDDEDEGDSK
jgi:hypothetical protein